MKNSGEISIISDYQSQEAQKAKSQKDITINSLNSSNPERIYENLNSEIERFTEQNKTNGLFEESGDLSISNKASDQPSNDSILSSSIWIDNKKETQDKQQYYTKFELLKSKAQQNNSKNKIPKSSKTKNKNLIPYMNNQKTKEINQNKIHPHVNEGDNSENEEIIGSEMEDENPSINKVNSILVKSNIMNKEQHQIISIQKHNRQECISEPDDLFTRNMFYGESTNTAQKTPFMDMAPYEFFPPQRNLLNQFINISYPKANANANINKGSFLSTQYSSNKIQKEQNSDFNDEELNEK